MVVQRIPQRLQRKNKKTSQRLAFTHSTMRHDKIKLNTIRYMSILHTKRREEEEAEEKPRIREKLFFLVHTGIKSSPRREKTAGRRRIKGSSKRFKGEEYKTVAAARLIIGFSQLDQRDKQRGCAKKKMGQQHSENKKASIHLPIGFFLMSSSSSLILTSSLSIPRKTSSLNTFWQRMPNN